MLFPPIKEDISQPFENGSGSAEHKQPFNKKQIHVFIPIQKGPVSPGPLFIS